MSTLVNNEPCPNIVFLDILNYKATMVSKTLSMFVSSLSHPFKFSSLRILYIQFINKLIYIYWGHY